MKIYFIRHAEGYHNVNEDWNILYPKLTKKGIAQCRNVAKEMKKLEIDLVAVSPLRRTMETGSIIFKERRLLDRRRRGRLSKCKNKFNYCRRALLKASNPRANRKLQKCHKERAGYASRSQKRKGRSSCSHRRILL